MDLFGIGPIELVFVLLVATLVLGPARMVDLARNLGTYWREAQRLLRETADAATVKLDTLPPPEDETEDEDEATTDLPQPEGSVTSGNGLDPAAETAAAADPPETQEEAPRRG